MLANGLHFYSAPSVKGLKSTLHYIQTFTHSFADDENYIVARAVLGGTLTEARLLNTGAPGLQKKIVSPPKGKEGEVSYPRTRQPRETERQLSHSHPCLIIFKH